MNAARFREIRDQLGLSQAKLGAVTGHTPNYIARLEASHKQRRPVPGSLARLMEAYASGYRPDDWPAES